MKPCETTILTADHRNVDKCTKPLVQGTVAVGECRHRSGKQELVSRSRGVRSDSATKILLRILFTSLNERVSRFPLKNSYPAYLGGLPNLLPDYLPFTRFILFDSCQQRPFLYQLSTSALFAFYDSKHYLVFRPISIVHVLIRCELRHHVSSIWSTDFVPMLLNAALGAIRERLPAPYVSH